MSSSLKLFFLLLSLLSFVLPWWIRDFDEQVLIDVLEQGDSDAVQLYAGNPDWTIYWRFSDNPIISTSQPINYFSLPAPHIVEFGYGDKAVGQLLFNGFYPKNLGSTFPELPDKRFVISGKTKIGEIHKNHTFTLSYGESRKFDLFKANDAIRLLVEDGFKKTIKESWDVKFYPEESSVSDSLEFVLNLNDKKCVIACKACSKSAPLEFHIRDAIRFFIQYNLSAKLAIKPENEEDCRSERNPESEIKTYSQLLTESFNEWASMPFLRLRFFSPIDLRAGGKRTDSVKLTSALFRSKKKGKFVFSVSEKAENGAPVKFYKVVDFKFNKDLPTLLEQEKFIFFIEPIRVAENQKFTLGEKKFRVPLKKKMTFLGMLKALFGFD